MIQLNLLPDVKLEYIKAQRQRRFVLVVSLLVSGGVIALLAILLSVNFVQNQRSKALSKDIAAKSQELKTKPQIDRILTVQNQLESLTTLHATKPAASRLLGYLNQLTPDAISINDFKVDYANKTFEIDGDADALSSVNKYIDTLKFTTYTTSTDTTSTKTTNTTNAFSDVVLDTFGLNKTEEGVKGKPAKYSIKLAYDAKIFDNTQTISLQVPSITTTRSSIDKPSDLFQAVQQQVTTGTTR